jgi:hypothetical protein
MSHKQRGAEFISATSDMGGSPKGAGGFPLREDPPDYA